MHVGIKFPTLEIGTDVGRIREWALRAHALGFHHVVVLDHVLGVDRDAHPGYDKQFPGQTKHAPYGVPDPFHEPIALMSFMAALCEGMEFTTGVLIAPQRQTALLAKQAAQVDLLSGGRLRLCLGVGWSPVEYEALGADFKRRGRVMEEQLDALRALWTQETVDIRTEFHTIYGVGLSPNAVQRPIPLWLGGWSSTVLERIGRLADGWYLPSDLTPEVMANWDFIRRTAESAGRDPELLGLEGSVDMKGAFDDLPERAARWEAAGASHLAVGTMRAGLSPDQHVDALDDIAEQLGLQSR